MLASTCRTVAPLRLAPRVVNPSGMSTRWSRSLATNCSASVANKVNAAKTWDLSSCLEDHAQTFVRLPKILGAYVGPNAIEPDLNESIMVTVNSVNDCPYCEGLHGQLARVAGVEHHDKLQKAKTDEESFQAFRNETALVYARVFAENKGRGEQESQAFESLAKDYGVGKANSIRALCWFLQYGSFGGNTVNSAVFGRLQGTPKEGSSVLFDAAFTVYYGPFFGIIWVMNQGLKLLPKIPAAASSGIGVALTFVAGTYLAPVGVAGLLAGKGKL